MKRFMSIIIIQSALFSFLAIYIVVAHANAQGNSQGTLELSELIKEAVERNPEIMAARDRWQSAQEIIEARRGFPDPQFSYTYFVEKVETRVGPMRNIFGAKQKFPFYGKRDLRADVAAKEAETLGATYEAIKQEVVRQVKKNFYDLFYISTIVDITKNEKEILRRFERIARTKYETGKGSQQDILKVQVEISKIDERLFSLANQKQTAEAILNT